MPKIPIYSGQRGDHQGDCPAYGGVILKRCFLTSAMLINH